MGSKSALETRKRLAIAGCGAVALLVFLFAGPHTGNTGTGEAVAAETESDRRLSPSGNADDLQAAAVGLGNPQEGQVEEPASVPRSNFRCFESDEFAQICTYELMCFDGDKVVLVDDRHEDYSRIEHHHQVGDDTRGAHNFDVCPRPPPKSHGLPVNTRLEGYWRNPTSLFDGTTEIEWTDKAMWLVEPEYRSWEMQHIFFWAHAVFGMWEARVSNSTWGNAMPPLEEVHILKPAAVTYNGWNKGTLDVILDGFNTDVRDLDSSKHLSPTKLRCTRRGAVPGQKSTIFSGIRGATLFRQAVYSKFGIQEPERPPKHLVIYNREGAGRSFENIADLEALLRKHNVPYTVFNSPGSFENQVKLMSGAGVFMVAHGAAATNAIFQPHRSVTIEVFPYLRKRFGFMQASTQAGMFYRPIFTWEKPTTGDDLIHKDEFRSECEHVSSITTNHIRACDLAQKVARIKLPLEKTWDTIRDAFDSIGYRVDL